MSDYNDPRFIDFEVARKNVMNVLAGKVTTPVAVKVYAAMKEAAVDAVEVIHGQWDDFADKHDKQAKRHDFRCSVCHNRASRFVGGREDWWDIGKPNYCPNCGAKMDGGTDNGNV